MQPTAGAQSPDQTSSAPPTVESAAPLPGIGEDGTPVISAESLPVGVPAAPGEVDPAANADEFVAAVRSIQDVFATGDGQILIAGETYCVTLEQAFPDHPMDAIPWMIKNASVDDRLAVQYLCPDYQDALTVAATGFTDGTQTVTSNPSTDPDQAQIKPGTYKTIVPDTAGVSNCSWRRTAADGTTVASDYIPFTATGVTVTVKAGESFTSASCGDWLPTK